MESEAAEGKRGIKARGGCASDSVEIALTVKYNESAANQKRRDTEQMLEICRFYGIIIRLYFNREHNPPHFHAVYGEKEGVFDINTLELLYGDLPSKAQVLVKEWETLYKSELTKMWETKILQKLEPLE